MSNVYTYINEYLSITGRPAATLTVEEYLKFTSFTNNDGTAVTSHDNIDTNTTNVSFAQDHKSGQQAKAIANIPEKSKPLNEEKKEKQTVATADPLRLLRSVNG